LWLLFRFTELQLRRDGEALVIVTPPNSAGNFELELYPNKRFPHRDYADFVL
jgi:hypothetical protein